VLRKDDHACAVLVPLWWGKRCCAVTLVIFRRTGRRREIVGSIFPVYFRYTVLAAIAPLARTPPGRRSTRTMGRTLIATAVLLTGYQVFA
jgi:hypothetical protein